MKRSIEFLFATSLLLGADLAGVAWADDSIPLAERFSLASKVLDEERTYLVHRPEGFDANVPYPLLVLLDGADHLGYVSGVADFLASNDRIPQLLIVAIENTNRGRDLPTELEPAGATAKFLSFIVDELIPEVERKYRTRPYRILVGHSNAATFTIFTLLNEPDAFDAYIAISPFLWANDEALVEAAKPFLAEHRGLRADLFFSVGDEEDTDTIASGLKLAAVLEGSVNWQEQFKERQLRWTFRRLPGETHMSTGLPTVVEGLETVFDGWHLADPFAAYDLGGTSALQKHYQKVSERLGYAMPVPYGAFSTVKQVLVQRERLEEAEAVMRTAVDAYPDSANAHVELAALYADMRARQKAIAELEAALRLDPNHGAARRMLDDYK